MTNPPPVALNCYPLVHSLPAVGETISEMRANVDRTSKAYASGDMVLRWVNEGAIMMHEGLFASPSADMQAVASGELERLRAALRVLHDGLAWDWRGHLVGDLPTLREIARTALEGSTL